MEGLDGIEEDLPIANAVKIVEYSINKNIDKANSREMRSDLFADTIWQVFHNDVLLEKGLVPTISPSKVLKGLKEVAKTIYSTLQSQKPDFDILKQSIKAIDSTFLTKLCIQCRDIDDDVVYEIARQIRPLVWANTVKPYIPTLLERNEAIGSTSLLQIWKKSAMLLDRDDEAAQELAICAKEANEISTKYTEDNSMYFCKTIENTNDIRELENIFNAEDGITLESWNKKHGAYVKISLMYAISVIHGTVDTEVVRKVTNVIAAILEKHSIPYNEGYILNPTKDGLIGPNSLFIDRIQISAKEEISTVLKYATRFLTDNIQDPGSIKDLVRFRIVLTQDLRDSHYIFKDREIDTDDERKDLAMDVVSRGLAIIMKFLGTSYDENRTKNSIITEEPFNIKSVSDNNNGVKHRAMHVTVNTSVDCEYDNGSQEGNLNVSEYGTNHPIEVQLLKYISEKEYEEDISEYQRKKIEASKSALGIGVTFTENLNNFCEVFLNHHEFKADSLEARYRIERCSINQKPRRTYKQYVGESIIKTLLSDDPKTICAIEKSRIPVQRLEQTLNEIEAYNEEILYFRTRKLIDALSDSIEDYIDDYTQDYIDDCDLIEANRGLYYLYNKGEDEAGTKNHSKQNCVFKDVVERFNFVKKIFRKNLNEQISQSKDLDQSGDLDLAVLAKEMVDQGSSSLILKITNIINQLDEIVFGEKARIDQAREVCLRIKQKRADQHPYHSAI